MYCQGGVRTEDRELKNKLNTFFQSIFMSLFLFMKLMRKKKQKLI